MDRLGRFAIFLLCFQKILPVIRSSIFLLTAVLIFACRKKIETREVKVPVEKKTSWQEIKDRFHGTERVFLSSGKSSNAIYLQQPFYFTEVKNSDIYAGITVYGAALPTNVYLKIPIGENFYAYPYSETAIRAVNNQHPVTYTTGGYVDLKDLDSTATKIQTSYLTLFKFGAISKNGVLLFSYFNKRPGAPFTFLLMKVTTSNLHPYADTVWTKQVTILRVSNTVDVYVRHISAVNNYFLLDLSGNGLYRIKEDGSFNRVHKPAIVDAFYAWKGKVYAHAEWDKVLISENDGDTWNEYSGTNTAMTLSTYHVVKDSLVGAYRDNLFTLRWEGPNYSMRLLKNDGIGGAAINGVEVLRDSVYVATTAGLYTKSVKEFFESK